MSAAQTVGSNAELVRCILEELVEDDGSYKGLLAELCLVARLWDGQARQLLWRKMKFPMSVHHLMSCEMQMPRTANYIKSLTLESSDFDTADAMIALVTFHHWWTTCSQIRDISVLYDCDEPCDYSNSLQLLLAQPMTGIQSLKSLRLPIFDVCMLAKALATAPSTLTDLHLEFGSTEERTDPWRTHVQQEIKWSICPPLRKLTLAHFRDVDDNAQLDFQSFRGLINRVKETLVDLSVTSGNVQLWDHQLPELSLPALQRLHLDLDRRDDTLVDMHFPLPSQSLTVRKCCATDWVKLNELKFAMLVSHPARIDIEALFFLECVHEDVGADVFWYDTKPTWEAHGIIVNLVRVSDNGDVAIRLVADGSGNHEWVDVLV